MEETFDELVTKHTRRDLEEMALKYGVENFSGTKAQLADAILEAMKNQKDQPKSVIQASPKEALMVEKSKPAAKLATVGKKGVMAKVAAIDNKTAEMKQGIAVFMKSVDAQIKENHEAAAKIYSGARAIQSRIDSQIKENHEAAAKIYSGARAIQSRIDSQITEMKNYTSDFYYG